MSKIPKKLREMSSLVEVVATLRGPEGCPWDKEQTHRSLTPYAIEEATELAEAIESGDSERTKDELGDVLLQVVLHSQIAREAGTFDLNDVIENLNQKMIRRHPHVFGDVQAPDAATVVKNWEQIKKGEAQSKGAKKTALDVPVALPALQRSGKIGSRTRKLGFDWENAEQVLEKVREEMGELEEACESEDEKHIRHELGDLLFSLAQLSRHLGFEPEQCLRETNQRFENRFEKMLSMAQEQGLIWNELASEQKESLWAQVKKLEKA